MQGKYIPRECESTIVDALRDFPAVAIIGPRQCGKSTLAGKIISERDNTLFLDLEKPSDARKLNEPELFFSQHQGKLVCLDEIQRIPDLFPVLRSIIDEQGRNGRFLILGSATQELLKQSSETLAGRIAYFELTPFRAEEIFTGDLSLKDLNTLWMRGGFPDSILARNDKSSIRWRENFIRTFLERDMPQLGITIPAGTLRRVWQLCAHNNGQLFNASQLGMNVGASHTTIRRYIDLMSQTFMIRVLPPLEKNLKKRLIKSPKVYLRDTGILHSLLSIDTMDDLLGHPACGMSWESLVIENIISKYSGWDVTFYRTAAGAELDLVLTRGRKRIAIECKASAAPKVSRGFWSAIKDVEADEAWIIAPVDSAYHIAENVIVRPLSGSESS